MSKAVLARYRALQDRVIEIDSKAKKLLNDYAMKHTQHKVGQIVWRRDANNRKQYFRIDRISGHDFGGDEVYISVTATPCTKQGERRGRPRKITALVVTPL